MKTLFLFLLTAVWLPIQAQYWQPLGGGLDNAVLDLYADSADGKIYAVGQFFYADTNNLQVNNIAVWNGTNWDSVCHGSSSGITYSITKYQNHIYSDGRFFWNSFYNMGGRFNGICWDTLVSGANNSIYDFFEFNNELYVAGGFSTAGGIPSPIIAKWDGTNWYGMNCPFENFARSLMEYNGQLYIGGNIFDSLGNNVDIISWNGTGYSVVGGGIHGGLSGIDDMVIYHGELYVGGYFTTSAGNAGNHIMKWNGSSWSDVGGGTNNEVRCLAVYNDELYVGGSFTTVGAALAIPHLAKWNGSSWSAATGSIIQGGAIESIVFLGNTMFIGGGITQIDTVVCNNIAKYTFLTSIEERGHGQFSIYPNPTSDRIIVKVNSEKLNNPTLIILNSLGETVLQSNIQVSASEFNIDLRKLPSGIYFLQIRSTDRISGCKKVIKL